jgi:[methyl-Co(III) methanol-specific corrinoid protein]:coenzyme M methyltransferase
MAVRDSALDRVEALLRHRPNAEPICSSPLQTATLEQMSRVDANWPAAHTDPELMARLAGAAHEIAGLQGVRVPFDVCVEAEALGSRVSNGRIDTPPAIIGPAFEAIEEVRVPVDGLTRGRIPLLLRALDLLRRRYGDRLPIYAMAVGPLTLLGYVAGIERALYALSTRPELVRMSLEAVTAYVTEVAAALAEHGNGFVVLADPVASPDLLPPEQFLDYVLPTYLQIGRRVHARIILHICGNTGPVLPGVAGTGFAAFSFHGPQVAVADAKQLLGEKLALVGNVPPILLRFGSREAVRNAARRAIRDGIHFLAPGCGLHPLTPLQNIRALVGALGPKA